MTVPPVSADVPDLADRAIALAGRWAAETAGAGGVVTSARLADILSDPDVLPFARGVVDGVLRPESAGVAASVLHRLAPRVPDALPWYVKGAVQLGGALAPVLPAPTVPLARRALRDLVGHLVVDARPEKLGPALATLRETGAQPDLAPLGEPVLGDAEADRRLRRIHDLVLRDDVDRVTVTVSAITGRISLWAFDDLVERLVARLTPLALDAAARGTRITLDHAEYRELDLTIAVFTRLLEEPALHGYDAGIVLRSSFPDALPALRQLTAWAKARVSGGGAGITVRLDAHADLGAEVADAVVHEWPLAAFAAPVDAAANHLRCLDEALRPEAAAAVRVQVAGRTPFDLAHARLLADARGVADRLEIGMPLGAEPVRAAAARELDPVVLSVPVVRPEEFDVAVGQLVRRLDDEPGGPDRFARERDHYLAALARAADPALPIGPNRGVSAPVDGPQITRAPLRQAQGPADADAGLTQAVLGIARDASDTTGIGPDGRQILFGGQAIVETAVYSARETAAADGAPGFRNTSVSDPALPATREWASDVLARVGSSRLGEGGIAEARIDDAAGLERTVAGVRDAAASWGALSAAERAPVLRAAARALEANRGRLIEVAAAETGTVFVEADAEVSETVDLANYYAATAGELDRVSGAVFEPARVTVVDSPPNAPLAGPVGGVLAALAAGSGVVLAPAPRARRSAAIVADALWSAGVPREVLALVDLADDALQRGLIEHPAVDRVMLTGSFETAEQFRSWRPTLPLHAGAGGKNAIVVMPSADLDLAAADLVQSAFGRAGQARSAASLAILVGPVARSRRFARQLVDATTSLRVGPASDPLSEVGPLIEAPHGALRWSLTILDEGERWLVQPRELDFPGADAGRVWTPGIRTGVRPGSRFHLEEFGGPVLGILNASSLAQAIDLQNAVASGLTAGLHTQHPDDLALWLDGVEAGNLFVNRAVTGAVVQRQPFGGWKRSAIGGGAKSGGPNHLVGLGTWRGSAGGPASSTLHLRGLDSRITAIVEAAQPTLDYEAFEWLRRGALSDAIAWDREFGRVKDVSQLRVERNLFRYRPVDVAVRATGDAPWQAVLRVVLAGVRSGSAFGLSAPVGLPAEVRRALGDVDVPVSVESDEQWLERMTGASARPSRVRLVGGRDAVRALHHALAVAIGGDPALAVFADEVTTAGRLELLPFLHEQSVSITAHRYGTPDPWSDEVI